MRFVDQDAILEMVQGSEPKFDHAEGEDRDRFDVLLLGGKYKEPVSWVANDRVVWIPIENIEFPQENIWDFEHAAGLLQNIKDLGVGLYLEAPGARVYKITQDDVDYAQQHDEEGDLEYELNMVEPWEDEDVGEYHAWLTDGNHRAVAAILAGATDIPVYVGLNYKEQIDEGDWTE